MFKVGVLRPIKQKWSYWDRSSALSLMGLEPTQIYLPVMRCQVCNPLDH